METPPQGTCASVCVPTLHRMKGRGYAGAPIRRLFTGVPRPCRSLEDRPQGARCGCPCLSEMQRWTETSTHLGVSGLPWSLGSLIVLSIKGAYQTVMVEFPPARPSSILCCSFRGRTGPPRLH